MSEITLSSDVFTGMVVIRVGDELTRQALLLTPTEAADLQQKLSSYQVERLDDPISQRESAVMKALTLYNGHNLPWIDRATFEQQHSIFPAHFDFEIHQRFKENSQVITRVVGVI